MAAEVDISAGNTDFASEFGAFAAGLSVKALNQDVISAAIVNIFDTLACSAAGLTAPGVGDVLSMVRKWGGTGEAGVWWSGLNVPAHHAALVNGMMAHARDFDDTHDGAILHAGVSVVPAAFAAVQLNPNATGEDLLCAVVAGLELVCRLGVATSIGIIESGFMYTSLFGHFAAAVAAARAMRLDAAATTNSLGVVYSQAAGTHQVTRDAALTKRMQPGFAAQAGVLSAVLSSIGINGARATFEGRDGLFRTYLRNAYDPATLREGLGSRFEFLGLSYKPYPCCRFNHTGIEAALAIRGHLGSVSDRIESIRCGVNRQAYEAVCTPIEVRKAPKTAVEAQFSLPYTIACALVKGRVGISDFNPDALTDPRVAALAGKVESFVDPELETSWSRGVSPARLEVVNSDGKHCMAIDVARGSIDKPFTQSDFTEKWRVCLEAGGLKRSDKFVEGLHGLLLDLPKNQSLTPLLGTLVGEQGATVW